MAYRIAESREDIPWEKVLQLLVVSQLLDPGSEFRVHPSRNQND
jgi:hypothetical protein